MSSIKRSATESTGSLSRLEFGRKVLKREAEAIDSLSDRIGQEYLAAVDLILACTGSVVVTGIGKAGLVGQKLSATLASTGTRSHFLHPAEALHGDLGRVHADDLCLVLSYSGETEEVVRIVPDIRGHCKSIIAITGKSNSRLAKQSDLVLDLGPLEEACGLGLAPSTSTAAMMALGDSLALLVSRERGFQARDFARFHPGGNLGKRLTSVDEIMRPLSACRICQDNKSIREMLVEVSRPGRRTGAVMLTNSEGLLVGIYTDSDLAKALERRQDNLLDRPVSEQMTRSFQTVLTGSLLQDALTILASRKISELPVVTHDGHPIGLIDVTDVLGLMTQREAESQSITNQQALVEASNERVTEPSRVTSDKKSSVDSQPKPDDDDEVVSIPFRPKKTS